MTLGLLLVQFANARKKSFFLAKEAAEKLKAASTIVRMTVFVYTVHSYGASYFGSLTKHRIDPSSSLASLSRGAGSIKLSWFAFTGSIAAQRSLM
jgi:hypothetical protein